LAAVPVPRWTTSRIIEFSWYAVRASIARGATLASGLTGTGAGASAAAVACWGLAGAVFAAGAEPKLNPSTTWLTGTPLLPAQSRQATAGFSLNTSTPSRSVTRSISQVSTREPPLANTA